LNANGSLKLSNTSNSPATDTALLPFKDDSVTIGGSGMIIAETADGTNPGRTTFKSNVAKGELSLKVLDVSGLTAGEEFTSTLDWTLASNTDNPNPLP
jgi:hypothetical protein